MLRSQPCGTSMSLFALLGFGYWHLVENLMHFLTWIFLSVLHRFCCSRFIYVLFILAFTVCVLIFATVFFVISLIKELCLKILPFTVTRWYLQRSSSYEGMPRDALYLVSAYYSVHSDLTLAYCGLTLRGYDIIIAIFWYGVSIGGQVCIVAWRWEGEGLTGRNTHPCTRTRRIAESMLMVNAVWVVVLDCAETRRKRWAL